MVCIFDLVETGFHVLVYYVCIET